MTTLLIIQSIGILIFFLSIIVLACMAVHYACTRFGRLRFGFYFCLEARNFLPKAQSLKPKVSP